MTLIRAIIKACRRDIPHLYLFPIQNISSTLTQTLGQLAKVVYNVNNNKNMQLTSTLQFKSADLQSSL